VLHNTMLTSNRPVRGRVPRRASGENGATSTAAGEAGRHARLAAAPSLQNSCNIERSRHQSGCRQAPSLVQNRWPCQPISQKAVSSLVASFAIGDVDGHFLGSRRNHSPANGLKSRCGTSTSPKRPTNQQVQLRDV